MVGPHDIGGHKGYGAVQIIPDEPTFLAPWYGNALGIILTTMARGLVDVDTWRARQENLHPLAYYELPYYERQLYALESCLISAGVLEEAEIEQRIQELAEEPDAPMPHYEDPGFDALMRDLLAEGAPIFQEHPEPPRFAVGDQVRMRRIEIEHPGKEHTRLPLYAQGKHGRIARINPAHNLPDLMVERGEARLEHTYSVHLPATDIWLDADPSATVSFDAWESYLEPSE